MNRNKHIEKKIFLRKINCCEPQRENINNNNKKESAKE